MRGVYARRFAKHDANPRQHSLIDRTMFARRGPGKGPIGPGQTGEGYATCATAPPSIHEEGRRVAAAALKLMDEGELAGALALLALASGYPTLQQATAEALTARNGPR